MTTEQDPIFAVIEAHRAATQTCNTTARAYFTCDEAGMADDDPRKIAAEQECDRANEVEKKLALTIAQTEPTTIKGIIAVLEYACQHEENGNEFADYELKRSKQRKDADGNFILFKPFQNWAFFLHRTLASAHRKLDAGSVAH